MVHGVAACLLAAWASSIGVLELALRTPTVRSPGPRSVDRWYLDGPRAGAPYAAMAILEVLLLRRVGGEPGYSPGLAGLSRLGEIPGLVLRELFRSHLGGLAFLPLAAPLLVCFRRTRSVGLLASLQIAFYLLVYAVAPASPDDYIRTSFARIASPFIPLVLASAMLLLRGSEENGQPAIRCPHRQVTFAWPRPVGRRPADATPLRSSLAQHHLGVGSRAD